MKLSILLFDTDPIAARALAMQLRHAGFATYVTFDGASAVSSARGKQFASIVVVADLADSQMRHCLHQIRDADPEAWLILIADPALARGSRVIQELGVNATIEVPFTVLDLTQRLSALPIRPRAVV